MRKSTKKIKSIFQKSWQLLIGDDNPAHRSWQFLLRITTILLLYVLFDRILRGMTELPFFDYHEPVIYIAFLKHFSSSKYLFLLTPAILFFIFFNKNVACSWTAFDYGNSIRFLIVLASGILAWIFSTYDFNLYFNQAHYADRLLLLALVPLIYWRPLFVIPFLTVLLPVIGQFETLIGFSRATSYLPIHILVLFSAFYIFYLLAKKFPAADFVIFMGSLFAVHYWVSGSGKFNMDWLGHDQIYFLLPTTYANGWLGFLDPETISIITQKFAFFNAPLKVFTLIIEIGACMFFLHIKLPRFFLIGWAVLHLGIFAVSGICFWVWLFLDLGLLFLFYRKNGFAGLMPFNRTQITVSFFLIISGVYWCRPIKLAWQDVPVNYVYRFEGKTENGKTVVLPPAFFAPYDYQFTLSGFHSLCDRPLLPIVWGASDVATSNLLMEADSPKKIFAVEQSEGTVRYNEKGSVQVDLFIQQYISNWNKRLSKKTGLSVFAPPRLLWTFPQQATFEVPEKIISVSVIQVTTFYLEGQYSEIRNVPIQEIKIPR